MTTAERRRNQAQALSALLDAIQGVRDLASTGRTELTRRVPLLEAVFNFDGDTPVVLYGDGFEFKAGLTIADTIFDAPYLATDKKHQGLLLHSVYHRPNGWDHIPAGRKVPCGEACMWGDYHAVELALLIERLAQGKYYTFF